MMSTMNRSIGWIFVVVGAVVSVCWPSCGQSTEAQAFDVASIKPVQDCRTGSIGATILPSKFAMPCVSLRVLIRMAYSDVLDGSKVNLAAQRLDVVGGPGWIDTDKYEVIAKSEGSGAGGHAIAAKLQTLLEDRFRVKVHKESKSATVYSLTIAKGARLRMLSSKEGDCVSPDLSNIRMPGGDSAASQKKYCGVPRARMAGSRLVIDLYGVSMAEFAGVLLNAYVGSPVVDKTGLLGHFDIHLEFVPMPPQRGATLNGAPLSDSSDGSSEVVGATIFEATEQLGLKLERGRGAVDVIIVDRAERPSAN